MSWTMSPEAHNVSLQQNILGRVYILQGVKLQTTCYVYKSGKQWEASVQTMRGSVHVFKNLSRTQKHVFGTGVIWNETIRNRTGMDSV